MDRSKKDLQANEVRAIRIGEEAIVELLWETLQEMGESLFDLPDNSDAMFHMRWNREKTELVLYVTGERHTIAGGKELITRIDSYIQEHIGITAKTLYEDFSKKTTPKYVSFCLTSLDKGTQPFVVCDG